MEWLILAIRGTEQIKDLSHNGNVKYALKVAYENLHIFGYYKGGTGVPMIKEDFQCAKFIIEYLSHKKIM